METWTIYNIINRSFRHIADSPVGQTNWLVRNLICLTQSTIWHYDDVIMNAIASQITSLMIVYSTVYSDADQSKHQSSASLAFVWGIHRDRWLPRTKGQLRGKCFNLMRSSWSILLSITQWPREGIYHTLMMIHRWFNLTPPFLIVVNSCGYYILQFVTHEIRP